VNLDTVCPDCGAAIHVKVKDGVIESEDPEGLIGYVAIPFAKWMKDGPYT
jgi:hypothetical protein